MATNNAMVRLFISSPGDVQDERRIVAQVVNRLNRKRWWLGRSLLRSVQWPDDIIPDAGSYLQEVINRQIGEYDVFLGIVGSRFGTATPRAGSGTEEEFDRAIEAYQRGSGPVPRIMLYFKNVPVKPMSINPHELLQVHAFKERVETLGVLPIHYASLKEFERLVYRHLVAVLRDRTRTGKNNANPQPEIRTDTIAASPETALKDMEFRDRLTYPQWADPRIVPLPAYRRSNTIVTGLFSSQSPYFRFGFKLMDAREVLFGPGNIQTSGQNLLLHVGKNANSDELFLTTYKSGIRLAQNHQVLSTYSDGREIPVRLFLGKVGFVQLTVDNSSVFETHFRVDGLAQLVIIAWGDEHHFTCRFREVSMESNFE